MEKSSSSQLVNRNSVGSAPNSTLEQRIIVPYFSLYSDRIVIHPRPFAAITARKRSPNSDKNLKKKKFTGRLSQLQQKQIKKKLTAWLSGIQAHNNLESYALSRKEHFPVFITLTLSANQWHTDQEIKRILLDPMIKKLKSAFKVENYFWKAERQKNGRIHFHLIVDKWCDYTALRLAWNTIQFKNGYISAFADKYGHSNPNSVDVRSHETVENFINYVLKYCCKIEEGKPIGGRVFGMSDNLRSLGVYQGVIDSQISDSLAESIDHDCFKVYQGEFYTVLIFNKKYYGTYSHKLLHDRSERYYLGLYKDLYNQETEEKSQKKAFMHAIVKQPEQLLLFEKNYYIAGNQTWEYVNKRSHAKTNKRSSNVDNKDSVINN